jgi:plastocyanin
VIVLTRFAPLALLIGLLLLPAIGAAGGLDEDVDIVETGHMLRSGFSPSRLTVEAGTTVTWRNTGVEAHSVVSQDQLFDSKLMDAGETFSVTFEAAGTYRYHCEPRPWMKGTIVVIPAEPDADQER